MKDMLRTKTDESLELGAELSESELEAVSGGQGFYYSLTNLHLDVARVDQTNIAFGGHNTQSNTAVIIQG
jgi:hypothetical protein